MVASPCLLCFCEAWLIVIVQVCPKLLKGVLRVWSDGLSQDATLLAYAIVRELSINLPYPFIEHCVKGVYLSYAAACRFTRRASPKLSQPAHVSGLVVQLPCTNPSIYASTHPPILLPIYPPIRQYMLACAHPLPPSVLACLAAFPPPQRLSLAASQPQDA